MPKFNYYFLYIQYASKWKHNKDGKHKRLSYRDIAKIYGLSVRTVEKWGSRRRWYLKRKYMLAQALGQLPKNLEWIYHND